VLSRVQTIHIKSEYASKCSHTTEPIGSTVLL